MKSAKIEALLERIAVALERLARPANHARYFAEGSHARADAEEGTGDALLAELRAHRPAKEVEP